MASESNNVTNENPDWGALTEAFNNTTSASEEENILPKGWHEMVVVGSKRYINKNNNPVIAVSLQPVASEFSHITLNHYSTLKKGWLMENAKRDLPILGIQDPDHAGTPPIEMRIVNAWVAVYDDEGIKRNRVRKVELLRTEPLPKSDDPDFAPNE